MMFVLYHCRSIILCVFNAYRRANVDANPKQIEANFLCNNSMTTFPMLEVTLSSITWVVFRLSIEIVWPTWKWIPIMWRNSIYNLVWHTFVGLVPKYWARYGRRTVSKFGIGKDLPSKKISASTFICMLKTRGNFSPGILILQMIIHENQLLE